jgi:hypothetical protein
MDMIIEFKETSANRRGRIAWKIGMFCMLIMAVIFFLLAIASFISKEVVTLEDYILLIIVTPISMLVFYIYRIIKNVRIKQITEQSIILIDGKKKLEIRKEDVLYAYIHGRYLISKNYAIYLRVKSKGILSVKFLLFGSDPRNDLIEIFKKMNVKIKGLI